MPPLHCVTEVDSSALLCYFERRCPVDGQDVFIGIIGDQIVPSISGEKPSADGARSQEQPLQARFVWFNKPPLIYHYCLRRTKLLCGFFGAFGDRRVPVVTPLGGLNGHSATVDSNGVC